MDKSKQLAGSRMDSESVKQSNKYGAQNNLIYNLPQNYNCRSMCSVQADTNNHRFLIGTTFAYLGKQTLGNEIHLVKFDEDSNRIDSETIFTDFKDNT